MRKGFLVLGVVLLLLSIGCIAATTLEVIMGKYGMGAFRFWGVVVFHAVTAVVALFLLDRAARLKPGAEGGGEP